MARGDGDELVLRAQRGEEAAWAELYGDHAERLVVWLDHLAHLDPATDAEDIAAEAWLTAARRVGDFSGDRHDFAGWLFGIARNVARSRYRATRRRSPAGWTVDEVLGGGSVAVDPAHGVASDDLARRLIAELPEREAQVVACIDVVGLDVASTGQALDMNAGAVRVAHHRGLRRLRGLLAEPRTALRPRRPRVPLAGTVSNGAASSAGDVTLRAPEGM
jgi:RNA polymerase sigma-70 factor (ECF subfamily)